MRDLPLVLVVDDNETDALFILRSLDNAGVKNPLRVVNDGEEFVDYMEGTGNYEDRKMYPLPGLVLLDLKLPKRDGFELLNWVRGHSKFSALPVIVLTATQELQDVNRAYQAGANSFLVKPMNFKDYQGLSDAITAFWLGVAKTPSAVKSVREKVSK
jgi:CheY-like chemotaxis protein